MREKITVLIADDNQEFSMTLATYLKNQEDMVVVGRAKDGNEALDMIPNLMPDVVLLDVIMPHLDGIGVLEKLNMIKMNKRPICIMLSAVGQDKITRKAVELGAEYYVVKPFDIELLITRIRELKNYRPEQNNNFISRDFQPPKQQYIEISRASEKKEENLEYRKLIVKKYIIIYKINLKQKEVKILHIYNQKFNYNKKSILL